MNDWLGLHDKRVLVAGTGGLGAACAQAFADAGAHVVAADKVGRGLAAPSTPSRPATPKLR